MSTVVIQQRDEEILVRVTKADDAGPHVVLTYAGPPGPPGQAGEDGGNVVDPGDLTLIFDNQLL